MFTFSPSATTLLETRFCLLTKQSVVEALGKAILLHKTMPGFEGRIPKGNDFRLFWSKEYGGALVAVVRQRDGEIKTFFRAWKRTNGHSNDAGGAGAILYETRGEEKIKVGQVSRSDIRQVMEAFGVPVPNELAMLRFDLSIRVETSSGRNLILRFRGARCSKESLAEILQQKEIEAREYARKHDAVSAVLMATSKGTMHAELVLFEPATRSGWKDVVCGRENKLFTGSAPQGKEF